MYAYEILECLEAVSEYEKGEGENIIQYENEFLLSNQDIKVLLKYIKNLKSRFEKIEDYLHEVHDETQKGILSSNNLIYENIERLCVGLDILKEKE